MKNLWKLSSYEPLEDGQPMIPMQTTLIVKRPQIIKKPVDILDEINNAN